MLICMRKIHHLAVLWASASNDAAGALAVTPLQSVDQSFAQKRAIPSSAQPCGSMYDRQRHCSAQVRLLSTRWRVAQEERAATQIISKRVDPSQNPMAFVICARVVSS